MLVKATKNSTVIFPYANSRLGTLNLRGNDSENTPFFISYLWLNFSYNEETITPSGTLFINPDKVPQEVVTYLKDLNITVRPYNEIQEGIADVQSNTYITRTSTNAALYQSIKNQGVIVGKPKSIVEQLKVIILVIFTWWVEPLWIGCEKSKRNPRIQRRSCPRRGRYSKRLGSHEKLNCNIG